MNSVPPLTKFEKAKFDEAQWTVLGTLLSGLGSDGEMTGLAKQVKQAGGLQLFNEEWSCELWRRIEAALTDKKEPHAYKTLPQVIKLPAELMAKLNDYGVTSFLVEDVYLPQLAIAAEERNIRRVCKAVADGAEIERAFVAMREVERVHKREKNKDQICREILEEWQTAAEHPGQLTGMTSGLTDLDRITAGWQRENLIVIGARPSQGKTALLLGFARAAAVENEVPTLYVTLESSTTELFKRMSCQISCSNQRHLRDGKPTPEDLKRLPFAFDAMRKKPIFFADCIGQSVLGVQNTIRSFRHQHGIRLVLVDYVQKIKPQEKHEKRTYEIAQATEGLKMIAIELGVPVITAAQLNREPEKQKGRMPMLSDLADSGQIERDADIVGLLHRGEAGFKLIIAKFRDGPIGVVDLEFKSDNVRFYGQAKIRDEVPHRKDIDD